MKTKSDDDLAKEINEGNVSTMRAYHIIEDIRTQAREEALREAAAKVPSCHYDDCDHPACEVRREILALISTKEKP